VEISKTDLVNAKGTKEEAERLLKTLPRLDGIVANAGVAAEPFSLTPEGYEKIFATNHLGHFIFIQTLLPLLEKTAEKTGDARIVLVGSDATRAVKDFKAEMKYFTEIEGKDTHNFSGLWLAMARYGRSKLCNLLYVIELDRRLRGEGKKNVYVNCIHPGFVINTGLQNGGGRSYVPSLVITPLLFIGKLLSPTPKQGAGVQNYFALSEDIAKEDLHGRYYVNGKPKPKPGVLHADANELNAKELWDYTEEAVKKIFGTS